ncbi:MAG: S-methyl-5-thioribose-1-phosphate isomerase [Myxococcales bacterium]
MAFHTLAFRDGALVLLDQRKLPARTEYLELRTARGVAEAIRAMVVRGAPAIGCAAAFGLALAAHDAAARTATAAEADAIWEAARAALRDSRPTAVNLAWALARLNGVRERLRAQGAPALSIARAVLVEAEAVAAEDLAAALVVGAAGAALVPAGLGVLTHCNAGALATAGYGTALGVIRSAVAAGRNCPVFACETRPWLQGARLTAWELLQDGIPVTLLPDGAAASLLASGRIGCAVVGADRIARNGDAANKIGTLSLALAARDAGVPFYVAAPLSSLDPSAGSGRDIPIEERPAEEVTHLSGARVAAEGAAAWNPAFDVTPARLVTAFITERGIARPPFAAALAALSGAGGDRFP